MIYSRQKQCFIKIIISLSLETNGAFGFDQITQLGSSISIGGRWAI
jgi:hypothetical protein